MWVCGKAALRVARKDLSSVAEKDFEMVGMMVVLLVPTWVAWTAVWKGNVEVAGSGYAMVAT